MERAQGLAFLLRTRRKKLFGQTSAFWYKLIKCKGSKWNNSTLSYMKTAIYIVIRFEFFIIQLWLVFCILWESEVSNQYGISTGKRQSLRQERKSHLSLASASQIFNLKITLLPIGQKSDQSYIEIEKLLELRLGRNLESRDSLTSCHILCPSPVNTLSRLAASPVNTLSWLAASGSHRAFSWYFTCMLYEFKHSYKR